jgi:uncharacterized protein
MKAAINSAGFFQAYFQRRWGHLNDVHVRSLAWLLDAPDLLDPQAPRWKGRLATLHGLVDDDIDNWLSELDRSPRALHDHLDIKPFARLGRYAEKLMSFYLLHRGILVAHGVQVIAEKNNTIGEFDFLLRMNGQLVHWEFATKFYLLESTGTGDDADYFVGPNLADTLGAKMHKIFERQLRLSEHPAAQALLPEPVTNAQALIKGWLFYQNEEDDNAQSDQIFGTSSSHCRGFWCTLNDMAGRQAERYAVLPRLEWLAPAKLSLSQTMGRDSLRNYLEQHFIDDTMPVMIALMEINGDDAMETSRGFVVPNDWQTRAGQRVKLAHPAN